MTRLTQSQRTRKWPVAFKKGEQKFNCYFLLLRFPNENKCFIYSHKTDSRSSQVYASGVCQCCYLYFIYFYILVFTSISNSILLLHSIVFSVKFLLVLLFITFKLFIADIVYQAKNYPRAPAMESNLF